MAIAAVISLSIIIFNVTLLAWYSVRQAKRHGGKTSIELRAGGIAHFKFGTEINGSPAEGDRSADEEAGNTSQVPDTEIEPCWRRWPWRMVRRSEDGRV